MPISSLSPCSVPPSVPPSPHPALPALTLLAFCRMNSSMSRVVVNPFTMLGLSAPPRLLIIADFIIACTRCNSSLLAAGMSTGNSLSIIFPSEGVNAFEGAGAYASATQSGLLQGLMPATGISSGCGKFFTQDRLSGEIKSLL